MPSTGTISRLIHGLSSRSAGRGSAPVERSARAPGVKPHSGEDVGHRLALHDGRPEADPAGMPEGKATSARFSSAKLAIASLLGVVTYPPPATLKVDGTTVTVDLSIDSLTSIAARVLAEARPETSIGGEEVAGSTRYRLAVDGALEPASTEGLHAAAATGFVHPERAGRIDLRH